MSQAFFIAVAVMTFLFGITVGSFLNVCIYRLPNGESLLHPPSHCPKCQQRLRPIDLVPLLSFLALRCRCRSCRAPISWRYFTIELITGLLFVACWWSIAQRFPDDFAISTAAMVMLGALCVFAAAMLVTFMIDLDTTYVIEPVTWVAMAAGILYEVVSKLSNGEQIAYTIGGVTIPYLPAALPGMVIGFLVFIGMDLFGRLIFRKPGMGLGDAFIGAAMGAMLGPGKALLAIGLAVALGAIIGVVLMAVGALTPSRAPGSEEGEPNALQEEEDLPEGRYMPFGPFLTACAVAVALAPEWFVLKAQHLYQWWMHGPFFS